MTIILGSPRGPGDLKERTPEIQDIIDRMENIMRSPAYMRNLSQQIIKTCNSVSVVYFRLGGSDWTKTYGLFPSGVVDTFKGVRCCQPLRWGYYNNEL